MNETESVVLSLETELRNMVHILNERIDFFDMLCHIKANPDVYEPYFLNKTAFNQFNNESTAADYVIVFFKAGAEGMICEWIHDNYALPIESINKLLSDKYHDLF